MSSTPDPTDKKSEKRKSSRLRRVGRRLLFRKGASSDHHQRHTTSRRRRRSRHHANAASADALNSSYGTLQETEQWRNLGVRDEDDDDDDEMSLESLPSTRHEDEDYLHPTWMFWHSNRSDLQIIASVEIYLRWMILLTGSFLLGVHFSSGSVWVEKICEYAAVAWLTCISLGILLAKSTTTLTSHHGTQQRRTTRGLSTSFDEEEGRPLLLPPAESADLAEHNGTNKEFLTIPAHEESTQSTGIDDSGNQNLQVNVHPALEPYFIVDCHVIDRVFPNASTMYKLDTDYFSGNMMVLIRTPDVDDKSVPSLEKNAIAVQHLRGKQRRFEFQFQVRLKKVPTGTVYFSCDLTQKINLGMVQRAFVSAAMSFVRSSNPSFHYSIQGSTPNEEGTFERPHMAFPVQDGMNRVVATPPGKEPPQLGTVIEEDAESLKRRKKGIHIEWNLEDTYTFSLWSAYVDFLDWRVLNLPGIRPFGLNSVIGNQPIYLTLYEIDDDKEKHCRKDMTMIAEFEMSNSTVMGRAGPIAEKWKLKQKRKLVSQRSIAVDNTGLQDPSPPTSPKRQSSFDDAARQPAGQGQLQRMFEKNSTSMGSGLEHLAKARPSMHSNDDGSDTSVGGDDEEVAQDCSPTNQVEAEDTLDADEAEADAAAELGEGIYVKSGDSIALRDATDDHPIPSFVTMGGGFAVLQEQASSTIIIEKAGRSRRGKSGRSKLIKSGDTVLFKLVTKGRKGDDETRYLSIHRGWWLKWVATAPTYNGFFTIYTHETEFDIANTTNKAPEFQSSYLTLGGAFWLRHRRWSKFSVGVAGEGSTTFGGRMLGLYTQQKGTKSNLPEETFVSDDPADIPHDQPVGKQTAWLKPLQLRALEPSSIAPPVAQKISSPTKTDENPMTSRTMEEKVFRFSSEDFRLDAPIWIEMMDRTHRMPQLAYVVRVQRQGVPEMGEESNDAESFVRIRTGRDLSEIMRVGLSWRSREVAVRRRKASTELDVPKSPRARSSQRTFTSHEPSKLPAENTDMSMNRPIELDVLETDDGFETNEVNEQLGASNASLLVLSDDDSMIEEVPEVVSEVANQEPLEENAGDRSRSNSPVKKRKFMGKLAQTVKSKTASTGKAVVRGSVKVGKGTMSAGKAILPIRSMVPPFKEPNQKTPGRSKRQTERDLHVAVSRSMRRIERMDSRSVHLDAPAILAGELAAPEQSARTVSNMLVKMSSIPRSSEFAASFNDLLSSAVERQSPQDEWFLQGGAVQLGVPTVEEGEGNLFDAVVARCLWESHWREEWCVVRTESIRLYAPNVKEPALELLFDDIRCIRDLEARGQSPLPGFAILVIETAWMCHYLAFLNEDKRDTFRQVATRAKGYFDGNNRENSPKRDVELRKARYWQGFKSSVESSLGKGKWAEISSGGKLMSRTVLNNRRTVFDLPPKESNYNHFVEEMLTNALSLSLDSLLENPETLVKLLDATSYLQILRLDELDFSSTSCFCLFVNIYHCLLQHALLLTVKGPLKKASCAHFMRTTCYEVGGDVFSLAELQYCVIRGGMSKASHPRPPYIDVPKKSVAFRYYSLGYTTARLNFALNTGDLACPKEIIVLRPEDLEEQLNFAASAFIKHNIKFDESKRVIHVPKVCDVYRADFGFENTGTAMACLQYCLCFLDDSTSKKIQDLLEEHPTTAVKFQHTSELYHTFLRLKRFSSEQAM